MSTATKSRSKSSGTKSAAKSAAAPKRVVPKLRTQVTPLEDHVLILPDTVAGVSAGGIVLPNAGDEKPNRAIVCAVGTGRHEGGNLIPMALEPGMVVLFDAYAGTEIEMDEVKYKLLRASNVLAILG